MDSYYMCLSNHESIYSNQYGFPRLPQSSSHFKPYNMFPYPHQTQMIFPQTQSPAYSTLKQVPIRHISQFPGFDNKALTPITQNSCPFRIEVNMQGKDHAKLEITETTKLKNLSKESDLMLAKREAPPPLADNDYEQVLKEQDNLVAKKEQGFQIMKKKLSVNDMRFLRNYSRIIGYPLKTTQSNNILGYFKSNCSKEGCTAAIVVKKFELQSSAFVIHNH